MELDPTVTLTLGLIFVGCTLVLLGLQWYAYRMSRQLQLELEGEEGYELVGIVSRFMQTVLIGQIMAASVIVLFVIARDESAIVRALLIVGQQVVLVIASVTVLFRLRQMNEAP